MKRHRVSQPLEDLPVRLRNTEPAAFEEFAEYFGPRFRGLFLGKGLPPDEAEDLAATCITDIQLKVDRYRQIPRGSFKAWVFVLARHALADWYRAKQRTRTRRPPSEFALNIDLGLDRLKRFYKTLPFVNGLGHTGGMSRRTIPIKVKSKDLSQIGELLRGGIQQVGVVLRALSLRQLADGFSAPQVAQALPLTSKAIRQIAHRYINDGLDAAVYAKQRPGAKEVLDGPQKQRIVAMVCSKPPEGRARWTVRLIAEEAVKRKLVPKVGRETIRILLQSHELKPWREKNVVHRRVGPGVHPEDGRRAGRSTRSPTIPPNRSSAWMRNRSRCMPTCGRRSQPSRENQPSRTTSINGAARRTYLASWNRRVAGISPPPRPTVPARSSHAWWSTL